MDSQPPSESYLSDDSSSSSRSSSSRLPPLTSSAFDSTHHPAPPLPPSVPALVLHKLCAAGLAQAGFDAAAGDALDELEGVVAECASLSLSLPRSLLPGPSELMRDTRKQSLARSSSTRTRSPSSGGATSRTRSMRSARVRRWASAGRASCCGS